MLDVTTPRFERFFAKLLGAEGGFNDIKADRGGATNFGISLKFLQSLTLSAGDIDHDGDIDRDDILALTPAKAMEIYKANFYDPVAGGAIKDDRVAYATFDAAVNCGNRTGAMLLQMAVNRLGLTLKPDGNIGSKTLDAVNALPGPWLLHELIEVRKQHYDAIITKAPDQKQFWRGWMNRNYGLIEKV